MTAAVDLHLVKRAFLVLGVAAALICAFFLVMGGLVVLRGRGEPQFPYELVIAAAGTVYFAALSMLAWRGLRQALDEAQLARTIRFLAQSVLGMFVPVALGAGIMLWFIFQPAY